MKSFIKVTLVAGVIVLWLSAVIEPTVLRGQSTMTPGEYDALVRTLEQTTPLPASEAPRFGNFYTVTDGERLPPYPGDVLGVPFWPIGGNYFILDNRNYVEPTESESAGHIRMDGDFEPDFQPLVYTSNQLWLQILGVTNGTASLIIHPQYGVSNLVADLLYCTNLTEPITWNWLLRTDPGQTNLSVAGATNAAGFYRLAPPNDLVANDSENTNFWIAFPNLFDGVSGALSLYISSPVGATGNVTMPGYPANGTNLIVTNGGDPSVNGLYILTNGSVFHGVTNAYVRGSLEVYYDGSDWFLEDSTNGTVLDIGTPGTGPNLLNNVTWYDDGDPNNTNGIAPTTLCATIPLSLPFSVTQEAVTNVPIPTDDMMNAYDEITTNGINITASQPVSVYGVYYEAQASAAFTGYPLTLLGTNYCVLSRPSLVAFGNGGSNFSELAVVATASNTTVTITPSATANLFNHAGPITNLLQPGETYQINSADNTSDVTGTRVTADKPIAVFAGANIAYVPDMNTQAGNPLVQEQMPVGDWGTNVLVLSFAGRTNGDSYRVLAASNGTVIKITGEVVTVVSELSSPWTVAASNETLVVTTNAGQFYDIIVDGPVEFQASQPIQVAQFANGQNFDNVLYGDPCEILLPSADHYLETNTIVTLPNDNVTGDFPENYLNLIVPQSAITNTLVDGSTVAVTNFVAIGTGGFYGAQITVTNSGKHTVTSSQPAEVEVYGFGITDAYSYSAGIVK